VKYLIATAVNLFPPMKVVVGQPDPCPIFAMAKRVG
jgi:hypothetical protein